LNVKGNAGAHPWLAPVIFSVIMHFTEVTELLLGSTSVFRLAFEEHAKLSNSLP